MADDDTAVGVFFFEKTAYLGDSSVFPDTSYILSAVYLDRHEITFQISPTNHMENGPPTAWKTTLHGI